MVSSRNDVKFYLLVVLLLTAGAAAYASLLVGQVTLRADSLRVSADAKSSVIISVEVLDASGRPAPDGTSVNLTTTLGQIISPVETIGGIAQTVLTPSSEAGTALVSAMAGSARATLEIELVAGPGSASPGSRMVELSADELSYSPDRKVFVGGPNVCLVYETVEIRADAMEYDVMTNIVCAQGAVVLKSGEAALTADALRYDLSSLRGRLLRVVNGSKAKPEGLEEAPEADLNPVVGSSTPLLPTPLSARGEGEASHVFLPGAGDPSSMGDAQPASAPVTQAASEPVRLLVEGEKLQTRPDPSKDPGLWYRVPQRELRTWVKARTAIIHPREKVILDHAAVYVEDLRVMGMRRHVMDPRRGASLFGNTFGYSSLLGADLDIPYYYRASGSQIGSLHFIRNRSVGELGGDPGWAIGLKEEWIREGSSEGTLSLEDITNPTRGLALRQQLKLGAGSALTMDGGISKFEDGGPLLQAVGLSYYRPLSAGRLSLSLSGSNFGSSEHYFGAVAYRFKTQAVGSGVLMTPVVSIRHSRRRSETTETLVDPETGETLEIAQESSGETTSPGFDLDISLPGKALDSSTRLTGALHTGYAWGLDGGSRAIFDARFGAMRQFAPGDYIRLDYSYSGAPASLQETPFSVGRQRLSLNGHVKYLGCEVRFNASQDLGRDRLFGNVIASRALPWGRDGRGQPLWALTASHMFSHLSVSTTSTGLASEYKLASSRLSLARRMGQYRLSVCYSPQGKGGFESQPWVSLDGYGYTYSGGRHLWIELSSAGF